MNMNNANRQLKARMVVEGIDQKTVAKKREKSAAYISRRMTGKEPFDALDMVVIRELCHLYNRDEFLATFFPGLKWES